MPLYLSVGALVVYFIVMGYVFILLPKKKGKVTVDTSNPGVLEKSKEVITDEHIISEVNESGKPSKEELKKQLVSTYKAIREVERTGRVSQQKTGAVEEKGESCSKHEVGGSRYGAVSRRQEARSGVREEPGGRGKVERNKEAVGSKQGASSADVSLQQGFVDQEGTVDESEGQGGKSKVERNKGAVGSKQGARGEWMTDKEIEF